MFSTGAAKPLCFAIMPITTPEDARSQYGGDIDHFTHVAEFIFKPAAEQAGYQFVPAAVDSSRVIQAAIIRNLAEAAVVLCDISLWNANVFFELGIRVALNKPVALVRDKLTQTIPFDNTPVHCYEYDHSMEPWCLKAEIPSLSEHIKSTGEHDQNELWKFAGIQVTAQQSDAGNPEQAKLDLIMAQMATLRVQLDEVYKNTYGQLRRLEIDPQPPQVSRYADPADEMRSYIENINKRYGADLVFVRARGDSVLFSSRANVTDTIAMLLKSAVQKVYPDVKTIMYADPSSEAVSTISVQSEL